jgi:hypothetical protein
MDLSLVQMDVRSLHTVMKWFSSPRLETRTKEFNMCASIWMTNPNAQ